MSGNELAWRQNLKVGDPVFVRYLGGIGCTPTDRVVDRRTATQIIVDGDRYSVTTGRQLGSRHMVIDEPTAEWRAEIAEQDARRHAKHVLRDTELRGIPTLVLVAAAKLIEDAAKEQKP